MSNFWLKIIAVITMTVDHMGIYLFPELEVFRIIGRLSFIIFGFLVVEGFFHTRNRLRYFSVMFGMGIFIDFVMFLLGMLELNNIFITLSIAIFLMKLIEKFKYIGIILSLILIYITSSYYNFGGIVINIMYGAYGLGLIMMFYGLRFYKSNKVLYVCIITLYTLFCYYFDTIFSIGATQLYSLLGLLVILNYNYQRGYSNRIIKYSFYIYYPLHLAMIFLISQLL